jgi:plastocyanin
VTSSIASHRSAFGWRQLAMWAAVVTAIVIVVMAFVAVIFLLLISTALFALGAFLTRHTGNAGPILLALIGLLFVLTDGPFLLPYLSVPASWSNFILSAVALVGSITTLIAAIAAIRTRDRTTVAAPRAVAFGALALALVAVVVAVAAGIGYSAPSAQPGDVRLVASNIKFSQSTLQAQAGAISVFVANHDTVLHTFTIDRLGVNVNVPAGSTSRATFRGTAGRYRYVCTLHSGMQGTLVVR